MESKPLVVGITGGIGSGKTTICKIFESLGAKTYYADDRAKWLMENDPMLVDQIKGLFGDDSYKQGKLDRKHIADQAFKDDSLLAKLNGAVHPIVGQDTARWVGENQQSKLLLKEAALLFETKSYRQLDKNILVVAPEEVRINRVVERDAHRSASDVQAIIAKQMSDEEKIPLADFVIQNDGENSIIKQVMSIYNELIIT